jgi:hypothetical protein
LTVDGYLQYLREQELARPSSNGGIIGVATETSALAGLEPGAFWGHFEALTKIRRPLEPGDHYVLLPPRDDVHRVRTTSNVTSVSVHLLVNETGCVLRHTFDEQTGQARPFRSGYVNAVCREASPPKGIGTASRL